MRSDKIGWRQAWQLPQILLCVLCALIVLIRVFSFDEPYERDLMVYAVIARELLDGRPLYSDLWDIKPPGIYCVNAFAQILVGYGRPSIFLLGITSSILTLIGIFRVVKFLTRTDLAALWASLLWVLICGDISLEINQPNVESLINAVWVWALFYFVRAYPSWQSKNSDISPVQQHKEQLKNLLFAGLLWGLASLFKQVALVTPLLLSGYVLFHPAHSRWHHFSSFAVFILPIVLLWSGVIAYFSITGRWSIFYFTMVEYGRLYAAAGAKGTIQIDLASRFFPNCLFAILPVLVLAPVGMWKSYRRSPDNWSWLMLCGLSIQVAIMLPGNYFPHYYQLWLPLFCVATGIWFADWIRNSRQPALINGVAFTAGCFVLSIQWPNWNLTGEQVSLQKYSISFFAHLPRKAREIDAVLLPNETFYQFGFDPGLYFETGRRPPLGILNVGTPFITQPRRLQLQIIADLKRTQPEMAVVDTFFPPSQVTRYLDRNYVALPGFRQSDGLLVMARRGGKLLGRNKKMPAQTTASRWRLGQ